MLSFKIMDNLGNVAEAEDEAAAATAASTLFSDSKAVTSVVITKLITKEQLEDEMKSITEEVGRLWL